MPDGGDDISVTVTLCHEQAKEAEVLGWRPVAYEDDGGRKSQSCFSAWRSFPPYEKRLTGETSMGHPGTMGSLVSTFTSQCSKHMISLQ